MVESYDGHSVLRERTQKIKGGEMREITIKTQKELDALPPKFDEYTRILITGGTTCDRIIVRVARENSSVVAWGNSSVVAWGNSSVEAWGNSSVVAWGNSSVVARENSSVEAWGNSSVKIYSEYCDIKKAMQESVIIYIGVKGKPKKTETSATVLHKKVALWTKEQFCELYEKQVSKRTIALYKSVNPETDCDYHTGKIHYKIGEIVKCPNWNPDPEIQCGNGLHLSPTPAMATSYHNGKILKCEVKIKDFVVYAQDITKVRCKEVKVIEEVK